MSKSNNTRTRYATIAALALAAGLAGTAYAGSDKNAEQRTDLATAAGASSPQLGLEEVLARVRAAGYTDISEIEREKGLYEVKSLNAEGRRVELDVDAYSGKIIKEERDD